MDEQPHREEHVRPPILEVLEHVESMETAEIMRLVKNMLDLAPRDRQQANKRSNEMKIDQIIANALNDSRYLCKEGLIERVDKGRFRITPKGRAQIVAERKEQAAVGGIFRELFGDADL